ncbi:MAG: hypothetical protein WC595_06090 [Candidatus Nanoarchaeia archaeon]
MKKGAIELSMNTVIIIILGVILLGLGIAFVTGVFDKINQTQQQIFANLGDKIKLGAKGEDLLEVSNQVELKQQSFAITQVSLSNLESTPITVSVSVNPRNPKVNCLFADTEKADSETYTIESGKSVTLTLLAQDNGASLNQVTTCSIKVNNAPAGYQATKSIVINVVKK